MKKLLLLVLLIGFLTSSYSYDKKSLVERFTNASCGPCATLNVWYNPLTHGWVNSGTISHLVYNVWWPGPNDPMYLLNQSENTIRTNYYGCNYVPWIDVNGTHISESQGALTTAVNNGNNQFAPFKIELTQEALSDNLIQVGVKITRDPTDVTTFGNIKLRLALTEKTVAYPSPPGSNGESTFYSICRKMLPDAGGSTFTIPAPGEFVELSLQYVPTAAFLQAVNLDSLRFVAFIQDDGTKAIFQSEMLEATPNYVAQILPTSPDVISNNNTISQYNATIYNTGVMNDTYDITCDFNNAPGGWTGEYTTSNGTFQFGQSDMLQVNSGDSAVISVSVNPNSINGSSETNLEFTSQNNPGFSGNVVFRTVTTTGVDYLVIDASGEGYGDAVTNSLANIYTGTYGLVSNTALEDPSVDLSDFYLIVWSAGINTPVLTTNSVAALQDYLDQGGRLFIDGQNFGEDIFEATGQSQFAQDFYHNYLHAEYSGPNGFSYLINGIGGDVIGDGIQFVLNDTYVRNPDWIGPLDANANSSFKYLNGPNIAGIRTETPDYRVVYTAFGIEQITDQAIRDTLLSRTINWLMEGVVVSAGNEQPTANTFILDQNYPNPFNPSTTISYTLAENSDVSLKIYNVVGQEVAQLVNEKQSVGAHGVKFDASELTSGIYFYKLTAGNFISVKKMTLIK